MQEYYKLTVIIAIHVSSESIYYFYFYVKQWACAWNFGTVIFKSRHFGITTLDFLVKILLSIQKWIFVTNRNLFQQFVLSCGYFPILVLSCFIMPSHGMYICMHVSLWKILLMLRYFPNHIHTWIYC